MTPHEALAEGRLAEAVALQEAAVAANPDDPAARRLLFDLLAFAGRLDDALEHLSLIQADEAEWPEARQSLNGLLHAERMRSVERREPQMVPAPAPPHSKHRWLAITHLTQENPEAAVHCIDEADAIAPHLRGFLDGQEFEGLRDADDRFGSILEAFHGGEYVWFAWEELRKVTLAPATVLLDQLYRPATVLLKDGSVFAVHLLLVYPDSHRADGVFALGSETDHVCPDHGPMRCVGGKLLLVGEGAEVPLAGCRMIEVR